HDVLELKWSHADSPYYGYGEKYFAEVKRLFQARPTPSFEDDDAWAAEHSLRLAAMESAMAQLDHEGLFGVGRGRLEVVINAEVMPPDYSNVGRARRLNPPEALREWLTEAAEVE